MDGLEESGSQPCLVPLDFDHSIAKGTQGVYFSRAITKSEIESRLYSLVPSGVRLFVSYDTSFHGLDNWEVRSRGKGSTHDSIHIHTYTL